MEMQTPMETRQNENRSNHFDNIAKRWKMYASVEQVGHDWFLLLILVIPITKLCYTKLKEVILKWKLVYMVFWSKASQ